MTGPMIKSTDSIKLVVESHFSFELEHLFEHVVKLAQFCLALLACVVSVPDVDALRIHFFAADDEDKVVLGQFAVADLFGQRVVRQVGFRVQTGVPKLLGDLVRVFFVRSRDGDDEDLARREPEGPVAMSRVRGRKASDQERRTDHFPPKCSHKMATIRSTDPRMAR